MSRKHWTDNDDVILLRQLMIARPFTVQNDSSLEAWDAVAAAISANTGFSPKVEGVIAQDRFMALIQQYIHPKRASSSASSKTKHRLLHDVMSLLPNHAQTTTAQSNQEKRETTEATEPICMQANEAPHNRGKRAAPIEVEETPSKRTKRDASTDEMERKWSLKERELELRRLELEERRLEREAARRERELDREATQKERELDREVQVSIGNAHRRRMLQVTGILVVVLMASRSRR